jgi:hypothetical protein
MSRGPGSSGLARMVVRPPPGSSLALVNLPLDLALDHLLAA